MEEDGRWWKHFGLFVSKVSFAASSINIDKHYFSTGMSHERLSPSENEKALHAYAKALPLFSSLQFEFTQKSIPQSSGKLDFTVFYQLRELWRWVERLLWRAIVLSSRATHLPAEEQPQPRLWSWLDHYSACSAFWPPTFRAVHRSTIYSLHLRAFVLRNHVLSPIPFHSTRASRPHATSSTPTSVAMSSSASTAQNQSNSQSTTTTNWLQSARSIVQEYRSILTASTKFPRAGQRNMKVEEFVDLCVAIWEAHGAIGEQAGWVIDVCYSYLCAIVTYRYVIMHLDSLVGNTPNI